jgi:DNA helicase MCM8
VVVVRFTNFNQVFPLSMIKSHLINKFVCLRGTVLRVSSIKVLVESIQFQCHECKARIMMHFVDGKWESPNKCIMVDCRSRIFNPEKHTAKTSFYQRIRIQEIETDLKDINAGKLPKTIDCEIKDDLIDACISGDIVTICGVMKTELQNDMKGFGGQKCNKNRALHASYIDVNSIRNSNTEYFLTPTAGATYNDNKVSIAELSMIHKIAERRDVFPLLIKSICPSIFGHEIPKTGILLCMFGGTDYRLRNKGEFADFMLAEKPGPQDEEPEENQPTIRPDIHLLMVGDPGLGKS